MLSSTELFQKIYKENERLREENKQLRDENLILRNKIKITEENPVIKEFLRLKDIEEKFKKNEWEKYVR